MRAPMLLSSLAAASVVAAAQLQRMEYTNNATSKAEL